MRKLPSHKSRTVPANKNPKPKTATCQVELYADYDQRFLLPFLRSSSFYPLEKAYATCKARGLTREVVFILGRMGNAREALGLIIEELHDMDQVCW